MRKPILLAAGLLALAAPGMASADVLVQLHMGFPAVLPPLVVVEPGLRVVQDFDEEVFFVGGYYFVQRQGNWYRTRDHRGTWRYVRPGGVPRVLASQPGGRYRHWQHAEGRAWPDPQHSHGRARHWKAADHQERHERGEGRQGKDDRHDRRGGDRH